MPIDPQLYVQLRSGLYTKEALDLSCHDLTDAAFLPIIPLLVLNPCIKFLNVRKNALTKVSWVELAKNTTLTEIALTGNAEIKVADLSPFESNTTLKKIVGALGAALKNQLEINKRPADNLNEHENDDFITADQRQLEKVPGGEASFQQLIYNFIVDLSDFKSDLDYIIWYAAVALNCYMHNASHAPLSEFSNVQEREKNSKLYYSRSQDKHPIARRNDAFIKEEVAQEQEVSRNALRKRGVGVLNAAMTKLFNNSVSDSNPKSGDKRSKLIANLNNINTEHGFPKKGKKIQAYFSLALAHGGLRCNNITATTTILKKAIGGEEHPEVRLSALLKKHSSAKKLTNPPRKIQALTPEILTARIKAYHTRFQQLSIKPAALIPNVQAKSLQFKKSRSQYLCREFTQWMGEEHETLMTLDSYGDACLSITIDPKLLNLAAQSGETQRQNITEVLIGFLAGIINHQIVINDASLWIERRQSFGFNLSTLTDIGTLKIRLSHGLEPNLFNAILIDSLKLFYDAIKQEHAFNPSVSGMRSEDKQWRAAFEAQYYIQCAKSANPVNYVKEAFKKYIENFAVQNIVQITAPNDTKELFIKDTKEKAASDNTFNQSPIFSVLHNSLSYAIQLACSLDIAAINLSLPFKQSYLHCQGKLYLNCVSAKQLLAKIHANTIEVSKAFQSANILLENIVEYSVLLDSLQAIQSKQFTTYTDPTIELCQTECQFVARRLNVQKNNITVYFTDSGQQAIVSTLLALDLELLLNKKQNSRIEGSFYNFGNSYFEVTSFIDDIGWKLTTKSNATLTFLDISNLDQFSFTHFKCLKFLVIDVTHQPLFTKALASIIAGSQSKGISIALVSSCLKHDELGLDKYTAGKITIITPDNHSLHDEVRDLFTAISEDSNTHAVRSYLNMVNKICADKMIASQEAVSLSYGGRFFSSQTAAARNPVLHQIAVRPI